MPSPSPDRPIWVPFVASMRIPAGPPGKRCVMSRSATWGLWTATAVLSILATSPAPGAAPAAAGTAKIVWQPRYGATLATPAATVHLDCNGEQTGVVLRFAGKGIRGLASPKVRLADGRNLVAEYHVAGPNGGSIEVLRRITLCRRGGETEMIEEFSLTPEKTVDTDLEIERPFSLTAASSPAHAVLPLYSGWARTFALEKRTLSRRVALGQCDGGGGLAPAWSAGGAVRRRRLARCRVCRPLLRLALRALLRDGQVVGSIRYRYAASKVPLRGGQTETRHFGVWLAGASRGEPFGRSVDAFFRLMLPDVPRGPDWPHRIAMVGYDFLSDGGQGWEKDVKVLARLLTPAERRRVALCFHGWYENLGGYGFDSAKKEIKAQWVAMGGTRKVPFTRDSMRQKLKLARDLGFRVLLYFGDGLLQDSGAPDYRPEWDLVRLGEGKRGGWTGPDTWGETFARNPAHPAVRQWYRDYLAALLKSFGSAIDGFVWDETFYVRAGTIARAPQPAYCDRAMMQLVQSLRAQVRAADPEKVFLVSDCLHAEGLAPKQDMLVGYALVADGTYQDTECSRAVRSYGLFPNWRKPLWDCCWDSLSRFADTQWGVEHYGIPVAIANGWGDDRGPWKWTAGQREQFLKLFRWRLHHGPVRFLTADPQKTAPTAPERP